MRFERVQFYADALLVLAVILTLQPRKATAQAIHDGDTLRIEDCEDNHGSPHGCGTWVFTGTHGHGYWPDGTIANLELEVFTENEIRVSREDTEGLQKGIKAVYKGVRTGDHIEGTVSWTWPKHFLLSKGTIAFKGTIQSYAPAPKAASAPSVSPPAPITSASVQTTQSSVPICYRFTGSPTKTGGTQSIPVVIEVSLEKIPAPHLEQGMRRYMFDKTGMTMQAGSVNGSATVRFGDDVTEFSFLSVDVRSDTGGTLLEIKGSHLIPDAHATPVRTFRISLKSVNNLLPDGLVPILPSSDKWITNSAVPPGELYLDMPDDYVTGTISYAGLCLPPPSCPERPTPGDVVAYYGATGRVIHVAVITEVDPSGAVKTAVSKWGSWGVYEHDPDDTNSYGTNWKVFHTNRAGGNTLEFRDDDKSLFTDANDEIHTRGPYEEITESQVKEIMDSKCKGRYERVNKIKAPQSKWRWYDCHGYVFASGRALITDTFLGTDQFDEIRRDNKYCEVTGALHTGLHYCQ